MIFPRALDLWLPAYAAARIRSKLRRQKPPSVVWVAIADHFEPFHGRPTDEVARQRVALWRRYWPEIAQRNRDSLGRPAKYSFFYAEEEYRPYLLEPLAEMVRDGLAEVEVHIHHDGEGERDFLDRMRSFIRTLREEHGLLRTQNGETIFGFIHGNWTLDNSDPNGQWCGLNNELLLLKQLGCSADFTLPSAPFRTQTRTVNTIYWATDVPDRPKSHDTGTAVVPGGGVEGDLLLIPGPLALRWDDLRPRVETGELAGYNLASAARARLWLQVAPRIGDHVFIKLFTHGTQERNSGPLLQQGGFDAAYQHIRAACEACGAKVAFISTWEMTQAVHALRLRQNPLEVLGAQGAGMP